MRLPPKRIAVLGFALECNRFAPVTTREDFVTRAYYAGEAITTEARKAVSGIRPEIRGFYKAMDAAADWTPVPIIWTGAQPGGPADHGFFTALLAEMRALLRATAPLDGVYICEHGAATTTEDWDPDGALFAMVRDIVGSGVPIVATLDLHANISERMVDTVDVLISYLKNPHTDTYERGTEAAETLLRLFAGARPVTAFIRLPITSAPVRLLTAHGAGPYADLIEYGQAQKRAPIINVSLLGGFVFADTPKNGMALLVTTDGDEAAARRLVLDIAARAWNDRGRYAVRLTALDDAVAMAVAAGRDASLKPLILADVADNPGGGGRGNTMWILKSLLAAAATGVLLGVINDPPLAAEAHALGEGARFSARFNRAEDNSFSETFTAPARVLKLSEGKGVGRRGNLAGTEYDLGPSCALDLGGVTVVVISKRQQCLEPRFFEMFGLDIGAARTIVVKSRGHFRAGFDEFAAPERIIEVDAPGLTTPVLTRFDFRNLPRPVVPFDADFAWQPTVHVRHSATTS
jgi:microcystin degradation protein MlrC